MKKPVVFIVGFGVGVAATIAAIIVFKGHERDDVRVSTSKGVAGTAEAGSVTWERLKKAAGLLRGNAKVNALPWGEYRARKFYPIASGMNAKAGEDLVDEWGHEFYLDSALDGVHLFSAGPDGHANTLSDNMYVLLQESQFMKACRDGHGKLSSPAVRQKIIDAFHRAVGDAKGYQISVTEKGVEVTCPPGKKAVTGY